MALEIYDPMVSKESICNDIYDYWEDPPKKEIFLKKINILNSINKLNLNRDATAILTEWDEFKIFDYSKTKVFDGRNILKT